MVSSFALSGSITRRIPLYSYFPEGIYQLRSNTVHAADMLL